MVNFGPVETVPERYRDRNLYVHNPTITLMRTTPEECREIGRIIAGSPAERCGRLHIGDRILAVNHVDINQMHHGEIVNLIKDSGYSVVLTVGPPIGKGLAISLDCFTHCQVTLMAIPNAEQA